VAQGAIEHASEITRMITTAVASLAAEAVDPTGSALCLTMNAR